MFCKYCGKELKDGSKFCIQCGADLNGGKKSPAPEKAKPSSRARSSEPRQGSAKKGSASTKPAARPKNKSQKPPKKRTGLLVFIIILTIIVALILVGVIYLFATGQTVSDLLPFGSNNQAQVASVDDDEETDDEEADEEDENDAPADDEEDGAESEEDEGTEPERNTDASSGAVSSPTDAEPVTPEPFESATPIPSPTPTIEPAAVGDLPEGADFDDDRIFDDNGLVFPDSDIRYLSRSDLLDLTRFSNTMTLTDILGYARNEIYARHGHAFTTAKYQNHYGSYDWYNAMNLRAIEFSDMNEIEKANIRSIKALEEELK